MTTSGDRGRERSVEAAGADWSMAASLDWSTASANELGAERMGVVDGSVVPTASHDWSTVSVSELGAERSEDGAWGAS